MGTTKGRLLNDDVREMLRALGRALSTAISASPQASASLERLRAEGYTLHLSVDCKVRPELEPASSLAGADPAVVEPTFRINRHDLTFLRSCGIDPTRRRKPRSGRSS